MTFNVKRISCDDNSEIVNATVTEWKSALGLLSFLVGEHTCDICGGGKLKIAVFYESGRKVPSNLVLNDVKKLNYELLKKLESNNLNINDYIELRDFETIKDDLEEMLHELDAIVCYLNSLDGDKKLPDELKSDLEILSDYGDFEY